MERKTRQRCSDEKFLEAVFTSKTYLEISEKTGQKITTTMSRYARTKSALAKKGISIPAMQRAKPIRQISNVDKMAQIVTKLQEIYKG